jgi:hypothetical protein
MGCLPSFLKTMGHFDWPIMKNKKRNLGGSPITVSMQGWNPCPLWLINIGEKGESFGQRIYYKARQY